MPPISPRSAAAAAAPGTSGAAAAGVAAEPQSVFVAAAAAALERGGSSVEHNASGSVSGSRSGSRPHSSSQQLLLGARPLSKRGSSSSLAKAGSQSGTPTPSAGATPVMGGSPRNSIVTGGSELQLPEGLAAYAGQLAPVDADAASTGTGELRMCFPITLVHLSWVWECERVPLCGCDKVDTPSMCSSLRSIVTGGSEVPEGLAADAGQLGPVDADAAFTGTGELRICSELRWFG
jgi:hypothetical protein